MLCFLRSTQNGIYRSRSVRDITCKTIVRGSCLWPTPQKRPYAGARTREYAAVGNGHGSLSCKLPFHVLA